MISGTSNILSKSGPVDLPIITKILQEIQENLEAFMEHVFQNVAEQLSFRELYDNKKARKNLKKMADAVVATVISYEKAVDSLKELAQSGFSSKEKAALLECIREVNIKEHLADEIEAEAAGHVFSTGDDDALAAMHMYRVLQRMDDVANACEKAANAFLPSLSR